MASVTFDMNVEFQHRVVALLAQDPAFIVSYGDVLRPSYFEDEFDSLVVELLLQFAERYQKTASAPALAMMIEDRIVRYEMDEQAATALRTRGRTVYETPITDAEYLAERVIHFGKWQALRAGIHLAIDAMTEADEIDAAKERVREVVERALFAGAGVGHGLQLVDYIDDPWEIAAVTPAMDPSKRIGTGVPSIDQFMLGGLGPGELGVVAGEGGVGKSMFLVQMAVSAALSGKHVVYYTLELSAADVVFRMLSCFTSLRVDEILDRRPAQRSRYLVEMEKFKAQVRKYVRIEYFPPGTASVGDFRANLSRRTRQDQVDVDLIIVDYADELKPTSHWEGKERSSYHAFGGVYDDLIRMGVDFKSVVWTASQVNREGYGTEGHERNTVADSMKKINKAHAFLRLVQTEREKKTAYRGLPVAHVYGVKIRRGVDRFEVGLTKRGECSQFREIPEAEWAVLSRQMKIEGEAQKRADQDATRSRAAELARTQNGQRPTGAPTGAAGGPQRKFPPNKPA